MHCSLWPHPVHRVPTVKIGVTAVIVLEVLPAIKVSDDCNKKNVVLCILCGNLTTFRPVNIQILLRRTNG